MKSFFLVLTVLISAPTLAQSQDSRELKEILRQLHRDAEFKRQNESSGALNEIKSGTAVIPSVIAEPQEKPQEKPSTPAISAPASPAISSEPVSQTVALPPRIRSNQRWVVVDVKCLGGTDMSLLTPSLAPKIGEPINLDLDAIEERNADPNTTVKMRLVRNRRSPNNAFIIMKLSEMTQVKESRENLNPCREGQDMITSLELMEENPVYKRKVRRHRRSR